MRFFKGIKMSGTTREAIEETYSKWQEAGNALLDIVRERGCVRIVTDEGTCYYVHRSVKYPNFQLTEFWDDGDEAGMLRDDEVNEGWDLEEILIRDFAIVA